MRKIGFGPFYLPLFCEYSRKQIEQGNQEIFFEHFAYETVKMYADYIHEIHLNLNFNDKLQLFELACFIHRKEMIKVTNSTKFSPGRIQPKFQFFVTNLNLPNFHGIEQIILNSDLFPKINYHI